MSLPKGSSVALKQGHNIGYKIPGHLWACWLAGRSLHTLRYGKAHIQMQQIEHGPDTSLTSWLGDWLKEQSRPTSTASMVGKYAPQQRKL